MSPLIKWVLSGSMLLMLLAACSQSPGKPAFNQPCAEYMPQGFTYVDQVAPEIRTNLKYAGQDNFIGRPLEGYRGNRAILRTIAAEHLALVSRDLRKRGYGLLLYDAYRPHTAMIDIGNWGQDMSDQKMKARFYPGIDKKTIFGDNYVRGYSEHSRGVAVDATLIDLKTRRPLDMGGHHDLLDPISATASNQVTTAQKKRRQILLTSMAKFGFVNYAPEWWHYRYEPEPDQEAHFYFPVWDGMKPICEKSMKTQR